MIIKSYKKLFFTFIVPRFYGGGGAPSQNTTVQQRNIPKELAPYYEVLLNSMMKQGFTSAENPGKPAPKMAEDWKPNTIGYAKGGKVDADGTKHYLVGGVTDTTLKNLGITDSSGGVNSKFNPTGIVAYQPSSYTTDESGAYDPNKTVASTTPLQAMSYNAAANMGLPEQNPAASNFVSQAGMGGLNTANSALEYGGAGYQAGLNAADIGNAGAQAATTNATTLGNNALNYGGLGAISGMQGQALGVLGGGAYGAQGAGYGNTASGVGTDYAKQITDSATVNQYMNPYLEQSLQPQIDLMNQQNDISNQKANSQAAQAGAYGGSRQLIANNLNNQTNELAKANLIGQGYKSAYDTAQANIGKASELSLQGLQTGIQGAQTGLSGVNAQLAGTGQGMQGAGVGLSGVGAATGAGQYGLSGVQTGLSGQQAAMSGAQTGLQGVSGAQSGYGLAGNAGQQLMGIGNQELAQQQSIAGIQNQYGAQQQANQQQAINNAITYNDYQQKYPWEILGNIGNALNGVQVGNMSQYAPSPSLISQVGGLGATALGAYGANGGFKAKKGGKVPKAQGSGIGDLAVYNAMKGGK
jgi:hypothetical protein